MSKVLKADEVMSLIQDLEEDIDEVNVYEQFMLALARVATDFAGGEVLNASWADDNLGLCIHFDPNDSLPDDGGAFKKYDPDVVWKDGEEV